MTRRKAPPQPTRLVSLEVAGTYMDISPRTVRRYIAKGLITGYRMGPRLLRVDLDEVDAMVKRLATAADY